MNQLLNYLQNEQEAMVQRLAQWVNQDSPTFDKIAVDTMGRMTAEAFVEAGGTLVATHPQPERGDHYTITYGQGDEQILLLCHFDTVWPMGEAGRRPFTIQEGRATGPGVYDMKSGTLITLFALKAIHQLQLTPRHKLVFLLTSDEEIGSPTARPIIEAESRHSRYCLVMEGSIRGNLTTHRKGIGRFKLNITGRPAHAGIEPQNGISAIEELARQIQKLHVMTDLERGVTVNVGVIAGGERPNIVAHHATAEIDLRISQQADAEEFVEKIFNLQPELAGCQIEVSGSITRWPFEESAGNVTLFEKAQIIANRLGMSVDRTGSGGGSDGNFAAALGVPTLDGLGALGGGAHAMSEHIIIESLPLRAALLAELIRQL